MRKLLCSEDCAEKWAKTMEQKAAQQRKRHEQVEAMKEAQRALDRGDLEAATETAAAAQAPANADADA
eukprot:CAMPEP_0195119512 /NCGR_PEP_ID=MMETSP0448-20130528/119591_1 /TAXON_ID=66468 /ORGANISM="Heterocapsa triquestra, Strain CCMP 448" /LENGTH=67 /DNA_ID=CAMNT_0040156853 /DNA_START=15 /DNA_END=218 /DNA_ORIENTATION=+